MQKKNLKIVLTALLALCVVLVLAGIVGVALGYSAFYASLIYGAGFAVPVIIELVQLYKDDVSTADRDKK